MPWHGVAVFLLPPTTASIPRDWGQQAWRRESENHELGPSRVLCANTSAFRCSRLMMIMAPSVRAGEVHTQHHQGQEQQPGGTDNASRRRRQARQGLPAPCPWARQTCSTGAVYKSSLSHALTLRCQPDLHASGATSLQLRQCAPARQTQSYACCNLIARAVFSSPFRPFAAPPPIQLSPAPSLHATLSRPCLIALTSPFPLCLANT